MTKKLWTGHVTVELEMAIFAETEAEALKLAKKHAWEEISNLDTGDAHITVSPYAPPSDLDDALPWGDFGGERERTVGELKAELGTGTEYDALMRRLRESEKAGEL